jgi:hypothetical protein
MTYKIISTRQLKETLFTTVEYNFDGKIISNEVAHFMPQSQEEIEQTIINNAQSILTQKQAEERIATIIPSLSINEEKPIE